jgi:uncharacterized membrane protein
MRTPTAITVALALSLALAACNHEPDADLPGNAADDQPFAAIGEDETIRLVGTEPFWSGEIAHGMLTWSTPEDIDGQRVPVTRFAGRGGLSFSGQLDMRPLDIAVTPASCSDGMSDRTYPYVATVQLGDQQLQGCAWSENESYSGGE